MKNKYFIKIMLFYILSTSIAAEDVIYVDNRLTTDFIRSYYSSISKNRIKAYDFLSPEYKKRLSFKKYSDFFDNVKGINYKVENEIKNTNRKVVLKINHRFYIGGKNNDHCENNRVEFLLLNINRELKWVINKSELIDNNCKLEGFRYIASNISYSEGMKLFSLKKYKDAFKIFLALSSSEENKYAQYKLSLMYKNGQGVKANQKEYEYWFLRSAKNGYAPAQSDIGVYLSVDKKYKEALDWFRKSAEQGNPQGEYNYGMALLKGRGIEKNEGIAFYWIKKSAEQGNPAAQYDLSVMYANGEGTKIDVDEAIYWSMKSNSKKFKTEKVSADKLRSELVLNNNKTAAIRANCYGGDSNIKIGKVTDRSDSKSSIVIVGCKKINIKEASKIGKNGTLLNIRENEELNVENAIIHRK